jgi:cobalt/nickel transport system permease protein
MHKLRNITYIILTGFFVFAHAFLLEREDTKRAFLLAGVAALFVTITLIPSIFLGNIKNSLEMVLKTLITVILVNILSYSTKWHEAARALKLFFVPDIFIMVFEITLRYIFILGEAALEMLYALKLKAIGKRNNKYMPLWSILGNLFLKSKEMGEEMYYAMECRGFTGEYSAAYNFKLSFIDWIFILCNLLLIAGYFISIRL